MNCTQYGVPSFSLLAVQCQKHVEVSLVDLQNAIIETLFSYLSCAESSYDKSVTVRYAWIKGEVYVLSKGFAGLGITLTSGIRPACAQMPSLDRWRKTL